MAWEYNLKFCLHSDTLPQEWPDLLQQGHSLWAMHSHMSLLQPYCIQTITKSFHVLILSCLKNYNYMCVHIYMRLFIFNFWNVSSFNLIWILHIIFPKLILDQLAFLIFLLTYFFLFLNKRKWHTHLTNTFLNKHNFKQRWNITTILWMEHQ